jgi:hypothetical protein
MKQIIAATIATILLCSSSAYAQSATTAPQQTPTATGGSAAPAAPALDVSKLAPNQREYLIVAVMGSGGQIVPQQVDSYKKSYDKMPPDQQLQMATMIAQTIPRLPKKDQDQILNNMPSPKN